MNEQASLLTYWMCIRLLAHVLNYLATEIEYPGYPLRCSRESGRLGSKGLGLNPHSVMKTYQGGRWKPVELPVQCLRYLESVVRATNNNRKRPMECRQKELQKTKTNNIITKKKHFLCYRNYRYFCIRFLQRYLENDSYILNIQYIFGLHTVDIYNYTTKHLCPCIQ